MEDQKKLNDFKLPETVSIAGTSYLLKDTPELLEFVNTIARGEKNKLYTQINELKEKVNELKGVTVTGSELPSNFTEELLSKVRETVQSAVQPLQEKLNRQDVESLDGFKNKLFSENEGRFIPELVKGNTKEELLAAMAESISIRERYPSANTVPPTNTHQSDPLLVRQAAEAAQAAAAAAQPNQTANPLVVPIIEEKNVTAPKITVPSVSVKDPSTPNIKAMSQDEFSKRRGELAQQLESMVNT